MKIRTGFVSNSSSSSFIIGVAAVSDMKKAMELLARTRAAGVDADIVSVQDIFGKNCRVYCTILGNAVIVTAFNGAAVSTEIGSNTHFFVVDDAGNEGDDVFCVDESGNECDIDYDIGEWFFGPATRKLFEAFRNPEEHGLKKVVWEFGAGRNG